MNYPNGIKKQQRQAESINYSNRGMGLEDDLNQSNQYYRENDIAYIYKKPTPIKITAVDYRSRKAATIKEAFFMEPSTTDYNGIYRGHYIDFEAKETKIKTSFPLSNIHPHQLKHLAAIVKHGGIGFMIVRFSLQNETYLLEATKLFSFLETSKKKSIPLAFFKKEAYIIPVTYQPRLPYLKIIDKILEG